MDRRGFLKLLGLATATPSLLALVEALAVEPAAPPLVRACARAHARTERSIERFNAWNARMEASGHSFPRVPVLRTGRFLTLDDVPAAPS